MTIERIWGKAAIEELKQPHSDPEIRKMEEDTAKFTLDVYSRMMYDPHIELRDNLPSHYRKVKLNAT